MDFPARFGWDVGVGKTERPAVKHLAERREKRSRGSLVPTRSGARSVAKG